MPIGVWTEPKTYSAGQMVTASDKNTYESGNLEYLHDTPACELRASISPGVGTSDQEVIPVADVWTSPKGMTAVFDTDSMAQNGTIVIPEAGCYLVVGRVYWAYIFDTKTAHLGVFVDDKVDTRLLMSLIDPWRGMYVACFLRLAKDQVLQLMVKHDRASAWNIERGITEAHAELYGPRLTVVRVGPGL